MANMPQTKCRLPGKFVFVTGAGQSSMDTGADHFETAAYDIALLDAGIENFNVMLYTSVLPQQAHRISMKQAQDEGLIEHGAVLETIKAEMDGVQGEILCTGVGTISVFQNDAGPGGQDLYIGGFAAEYEGHSSEEKAKAVLKRDLDAIFHRRYGGEPGSKTGKGYYYEWSDFETRSLIVDEDYGVCFTAICFLTYTYPVID